MKISRDLFYASIFTLPFFVLTPTSVGLHEPLAIFSIFFLSISKKLQSDTIFGNVKIIAALTLLILGYLISVLGSLYPLEAIKFPLQISFVAIILLPLTFTHIRSRQDLLTVALVILASNILIIIYFMLEFQSHGIPSGRYRYTLIYGNSNMLSQIIFLMTATSSGLFIYEVRNCKYTSAIFILFLSLTNIFILLLTLSRSAMIGTFILIIILLSTHFGSRNGLPEIISRGLILSIALLTILIFIYLLGYFPSGIETRIQESSSLQSPKILNRLIPYRIAIRSLEDFFFIGSGYNNWVFFQQEFATTSAEYMFASQPHNIMLMPFVEGGILAVSGILLLMLLIVSLFIKSIKYNLFKNCPVSFGLVSGVMVYLWVIKLFGTLSVHRIFWFFIILSIVTVHIQENKPS